MERSISDIVALSPKHIAYIHVLMNELKSNEVRMILEDINQNKLDPNHNVKKLILDLFKGPRTTLVQELEQRVLHIHLSKQRDMQQPQKGRVKKIKNLLQKYRHNSILSIENTKQTIHFAHNLPFFRTIHSLTDPIHCEGNNISTFNLTKLHGKIKNIPNYIGKSWDSERNEYKIQIILRLEQVGSTTIVNGRLPSNINISVNNYDCKLPKLIFPETGDPTPWRLNVPIDITKQIHLKKKKQNTLKITWSNDPHTYVAGVFLTEKLTSEDLLKEIKKRYLRRFDVTKKFIKNSLRNNDDMSVDSITVTLKDPVSTQRMKVPARGKECKHLQCFDAKKFLQMNEQKQTWECPICKEQVKYENIEIDEFFYRILQSSKLNEESENIILLNDGTWTVNKPIHTSLNNKEIIWIDSDEDDIHENVDNEEIEPKSKRFKYNPPEEKKPKHIAETVEVIKTNVNNSTKCDIIKNGFTPSASDNSIIMLNDIPGPSSVIGSNCILNNYNLPNNTNSVNIDDSLENKGKKIQEKVKSVLCVITLD
ncbi:E3 SUMO-protein ligase PIAS1-like [Acyrthosiphon pisum]|uniref:Uncharacterized protein n=1 Tax=Acyrthosiphon pisum TaxID=7029 RepID=A0A8R2D323_ACYPI|nr:E3 SUMO-protein ligase PIAS1-like [Acyrthosiphon pisum]|eukprot:XP_016658589.1 PREDICTED: E3 SUMO-protein ligase PIAS1-like [Acyrthosiphon pisum]